MLVFRDNKMNKIWSLLAFEFNVTIELIRKSKLNAHDTLGPVLWVGKKKDMYPVFVELMA